MIIFLGGSRSIRALPSEAAARIDRAVAKASGIVVGDAPGIDALIQQHLQALGVQEVKVYCAKGGPRNNAGQWQALVDGLAPNDRARVEKRAAAEKSRLAGLFAGS